MTNIPALVVANQARWNNAKLTRLPEFNSVAKRLVAAKDRYQAVERRTGVPWFVVAVIHEREASQDWAANIAQGDPWNRRSVHEPKGRGPFKSWDDAADDALLNCSPFAGKWKDWTAGGAMTLLEQYNGLGYAAKGIPSPYCWSGTDQYRSGKYVADHVFDPNVVDKQLGCAGLILAMMALDTSIVMGRVVVVAKPVPVPPPPDIQPVPPAPQQVSWFAKFLAILTGKA
jgi:lysozyme family protein